MKLIIPRSELLGLIAKIQNVVPPKPPLPILANILLEAVSDELILSATDLTVSMRTYVPVKVMQEGAITLPARRFFQLVRELTAPQVEIESSSSEAALVNAGSSHFKIQGMHKSEFPPLPDLAEGAHFRISTHTLKEMLVRTAFAAARDDSRQVLNGILIQHIHNAATFIGTDGKRLARLFTSLDEALAQPGSYILPLKAVEELIRVLDGKDEQAQITLMQDKFALEVNAITLITKLLSGQYPDVTRVIPQKNTSSLVLHREELISLLRQVSLFTSDANSSVKFSFTSGSLQLSAMSGEIGEGKVSMPVNYEGPKLDIAFNPTFFLDILRHSKDETVHFDVTDSYNPGLITDSSSAEFVIMPMRLDAS